MTTNDSSAYTYGDFVAVETFKSRTVEKDVKSGFAKAKQRVTLAPLKIVYGNDKIGLWAGLTVYVRGDYAFDAQANETFEIEEGKPFFLLPVSQIKLVKWIPPNA